MATVTVYAESHDAWVSSITGTNWEDARNGTGSASLGVDFFDATVGHVRSSLFGTGGIVYQTFLGFDTSVLGAGATVLAAVLGLYQASTTADDDNGVVEARIHNYTDPVTTSEFVAGDDLSSLPLVATFDVSGVGAGYNDFTENGSAFASAINKTGETRLVLAYDLQRGAQPTGNNNFTFRTSEYISGTFPRLVITAELPITRLYLPSTGTPPISPAVDSSWEKSANVDRRMAVTSKISSAMASVTDTKTVNNTSYDIVRRQYLFGPLAPQTIAGNVKGQIRVSESNNAANASSQMVIRVVAPDGTVRGTFLASNTGALSNEWSTTLTNRYFPRGASTPAAMSSVAAQAGDYLVIEIGVRGREASTTSRTFTWRFGDVAGTDLSEDESSTSDNAPWIEFDSIIQTISLAAAGAPGDIEFEGTLSTLRAEFVAGAPGDIEFEGTESTFSFVVPVDAGAPGDIEFEGAESAFRLSMGAGAPGDIEFEGSPSTFTAGMLAGAPADVRVEGTVSTFLPVIAVGAPGDIEFEGTASTFEARMLAGEPVVLEIEGFASEAIEIAFLGAPAALEFEGTATTFEMRMLAGSPGDIEFEGLTTIAAIPFAAGAPGVLEFEGTASTYLMQAPMGAPANLEWRGLVTSVGSFDLAVEVLISGIGSGDHAGVCLRKLDADNFIAAYVDEGDEVVRLSLFAGGEETEIATAAWSPKSTAEIRAIAQGERIRVWVDQVLWLDEMVAAYAHINGAGLFSRSAAVFDDFYAQSLGVA